ncbi:hypothetical protein B0H10DRAFT_2197387 [Mycena sp. CBHHK59/15]|nr:hypothetical protein B0H10DRAFT_2197387 [Mycena sp. CBHHK59/15]
MYKCWWLLLSLPLFRGTGPSFFTDSLSRGLDGLEISMGALQINLSALKTDVLCVWSQLCRPSLCPLGCATCTGFPEPRTGWRYLRRKIHQAESAFPACNEDIMLSVSVGKELLNELPQLRATTTSSWVTVTSAWRLQCLVIADLSSDVGMGSHYDVHPIATSEGCHAGHCHLPRLIGLVDVSRCHGLHVSPHELRVADGHEFRVVHGRNVHCRNVQQEVVRGLLSAAHICDTHRVLHIRVHLLQPDCAPLSLAHPIQPCDAGRWCPTHAQAHSTPGPCTMSVQNDAPGACSRTVPLPSPNYADFTLCLRTDSTPRPLEWVRVQQQQHKAILMLHCNHIKNGSGGASLHHRGWFCEMKTTTWSGQCVLPPPRRVGGGGRALELTRLGRGLGGSGAQRGGCRGAGRAIGPRARARGRGGHEGSDRQSGEVAVRARSLALLNSDLLRAMPTVKRPDPPASARVSCSTSTPSRASSTYSSSHSVEVSQICDAAGSSGLGTTSARQHAARLGDQAELCRLKLAQRGSCTRLLTGVDARAKSKHPPDNSPLNVDIIMGVPGLWECIKPAAEQRNFLQLAVEECFKQSSGEGQPMILGIEASIWMYQAERALNFKNTAAAPNPHLHILFYKLVALLELPIRVVFVFDGVGQPDIKRGINAPGKAEAELARMNLEGVLDTVETTDSDTLVFGASTVIIMEVHC